MVMEWCFFLLVASFTVSTVSEDYSCPAAPAAPAARPAAHLRRAGVALSGVASLSSFACAFPPSAWCGAPPQKECANFSSRPFPNHKFSPAPLAPIRLDERFSSAPLKTQHHWGEGAGAGHPGDKGPLVGHPPPGAPTTRCKQPRRRRFWRGAQVTRVAAWSPQGRDPPTHPPNPQKEPWPQPTEPPPCAPPQRLVQPPVPAWATTCGTPVQSFAPHAVHRWWAPLTEMPLCTGTVAEWTAPTDWTITASSQYSGSYSPEKIQTGSGVWISLIDGPRQWLQLYQFRGAWVEGFRVTQPASWDGAAFQNFTFSYSYDGADWTVALTGQGPNQDCCAFEEYVFASAHAQYWRLDIYSTWGANYATVQYMELLTTGTGLVSSGAPAACLMLVDLEGGGGQDARSSLETVTATPLPSLPPLLHSRTSLATLGMGPMSDHRPEGHPQRPFPPPGTGHLGCCSCGAQFG